MNISKSTINKVKRSDRLGENFHTIDNKLFLYMSVNIFKNHAN